MSDLDNQTIAGDDGTSFSEPEVPHNTTYPYNHVYESEGGHVREMDDTPGPTREYMKGMRVVQGMRYTLMVVRSQGSRRTTTTLSQATTSPTSKAIIVQPLDGGVRVFVNADASRR